MACRILTRSPREAEAWAKFGLQLNPPQDYTTRYLLHKSTLIRLGDLGAFLTTLKHTRKGSQNWKTRSRNRMRKQNRDPKIMESSNLTDAEFKTLVIKMLNDLFVSVEKTPKQRFKKNKNGNGNGNFKREQVQNEENII